MWSESPPDLWERTNTPTPPPPSSSSSSSSNPILSTYNNPNKHWRDSPTLWKRRRAASWRGWHREIIQREPVNNSIEYKRRAQRTTEQPDSCSMLLSHQSGRDVKRKREGEQRTEISLPSVATYMESLTMRTRTTRELRANMDVE